MSQPWNEGVRGTQVLPLINSDAQTLVVEAGPGTGKTFGLVRRVQRILHPEGLGVPPNEVLVVAFNRVIARDLRRDIEKRLKESRYAGKLPIVSTIHALCHQVIGKNLRLLMDHEREPLLYDVLEMFPDLHDDYDYKKAQVALTAHEAELELHPKLWSAVQRWLIRHQAALLSDLPQMLLDSMKGGDFTDRAYRHVLVDEFQDLTAAEQELFQRMIQPGGSMVALGDPRQSIYAFRGNDPKGLGQLKSERPDAVMLPMTECERCPPSIVDASNLLMNLSGARPMRSISDEDAQIRVVHWKTPQSESKGMAAAIAACISRYPSDRHLVMVTRRQFGYMLSRELQELKLSIEIEMNFSEDILETWAAREAFLFLCLMVDPDAPTWRAWFGYQNSPTGKKYLAQKRSSVAYLRFLSECEDKIGAQAVESLAREAKPHLRVEGAKTFYGRAQRFLQLKKAVKWDDLTDAQRLESLFDPQHWIGKKYEEAEAAREDLALLKSQSLELLKETSASSTSEADELRSVVKDLRYQIATREPMRVSKDAEEDGDSKPRLQIATLWGAKGVTADRVYVVGLCEEALPGDRKEDYPGSDEDFFEEQRRLFYVSITRTTKTLVLSRPKRIQEGLARRLGLTLRVNKRWSDLHASPFLRRILPLVPESKEGEEWLPQWVSENEDSNNSQQS